MLSEQARRITDGRREGRREGRRGEMVELKDRQPEETEGELQGHSCRLSMAQVPVPCRN